MMAETHEVIYNRTQRDRTMVETREIIYSRTQSLGTMNFKYCFAEFQSSVLNNNADRCREIAQFLSANDLKLIFNTPIERCKTITHLAAAFTVDFDIWKLILPYSSDKVLYEGRSALDLFLRYVDVTQHTFVQLQKIRHWLESTQNVCTKNVHNYRCLFLCKLCRLTGGDGPKDATTKDILCLAKELIVKYHVSQNGCDNSYIPLHWAMETSNITLLSLFLSYGADVNRVDSSGKTPLYYASQYQSSSSLDIACLMVDHGSKLDADSPFSSIHAVMVALDPIELDTFVAKYAAIIKQANNQMLPFPLIQGLLLYSIGHSKYRSDKVKLQKVIINKIEILLKHGFPLNMMDIHSRTILHYACWFRFAVLVKFLVLLDHTLIQFPDSFGRQCILYAISHPCTEFAVSDEEEELSTLKTLLNLSDMQCVQMRDSLGRQVQHLSVFENNTIAFTYLMTLGLGNDAVDSDCRSPQYYAESLLNDCLSIARRVDFKTAVVPEPYSKNTSANYINGRNFIKELLNNKRIGPLKMTTDIIKITEDVTKLVNKIGSELNKRDNRFQYELVLAGSMSEQTKTNPPDEFDFQFRLKNLSQLFYVKHMKSCNSVELDLMIPVSTDLYDILVRHERKSCCIYRAFNAAVYDIINTVEFWKDEPFYWCCCKIESIKSNEQLVNVLEDLVTPLKVKWTGQGKADVNINIDLVPILVMECLPTEGLNRIPRQIQKIVQRNSYYWQIVCRNSYGARLSFLDVERFILLRLAPELREVYQLLKSLRTHCENYMKSGGDFKMITSYMLKNALFHVLDPDGTYCLLENQLLSRSASYSLWKFVMTILTNGVKLPLKDRIAFIHFWSLKILDKIECDFLTDVGNNIYCCPSEGFLDIAVLKDEDNERPILRVLSIMKCELGTFQYHL